MCCEVLGICRSIWNKFNFDCCERYRKPPAGYHHHGDSLPGVFCYVVKSFLALRLVLGPVLAAAHGLVPAPDQLFPLGSVHFWLKQLVAAP